MIECPLCKGKGKVEPDSITVGDRFRALRGVLRQEEMSSRLGISRAQVANLEGGRGLPSIEVLTRAADEFTVTVDWLLGRVQ